MEGQSWEEPSVVVLTSRGEDSVDVILSAAQELASISRVGIVGAELCVACSRFGFRERIILLRIAASRRIAAVTERGLTIGVRIEVSERSVESAVLFSRFRSLEWKPKGRSFSATEASFSSDWVVLLKLSQY